MKERTICRGDLFYYDFGNRTGSVQSGERPVLVIQADDYNKNAPTIIVAAVTSVIKKRYLPSHIQLGEDFGLKKPSMVLLEQVQTVNKEDLKDYIGTVDDEQLIRRINTMLKKTFGLWIYKKEKVTRGLMAGSLLALVGVALVVYNGSFVLEISPLGDFLTLLAAFSWVFYSLIMRKMSNCYGITFITRKIFFYGVLTILPAFLIHPWNFDIARLLEPAILFNLLFLGVLASLICFVVWNVVLKQLGTIRASNYIYLNPLFTLVGSAFLLGEQLTIVALMGAILILGGVYWAGKK